MHLEPAVPLHYEMGPYRTPKEKRKMIAIRNSRPDEGARAVEIWRRAVDATHGFLTREDRKAIDELVWSYQDLVDS